VDWASPSAAAFKAAMDDDFNTPAALAVLFDLAGQSNRGSSTSSAALLRSLGATLGILQQSPQAFLQNASGQASGALDAAAIDALIAERAQAKAAREFARADQIRQALADQGVQLKDGPAGTSWTRA
jgi:cysteinyl-tRNA synthetase